jgi:hypothetical protein
MTRLVLLGLWVVSPDAQGLIARSKQLDDPSAAERERMRARLEASWLEPAPADDSPVRSSRSWGGKIVWGAVSVAALFSAGAWQRAHVAPHSVPPPAAAVSAAIATGSSSASEAALPMASSPTRNDGQRNPFAASRRPSAAELRHARVPSVRRTAPPLAADPLAEPRATPAPSSARPAVTEASNGRSAASSSDETPRARQASYVASAEPAADEPAKTRAKMPAPEAIDDEVLLLGAAQDALQSGHPSRALQLVQRHGFRFPNGALVQERLTVHVLSLCALQRTNAARDVYAELERRAAQSPVLARVRADCGF